MVSDFYPRVSAECRLVAQWFRGRGGRSESGRHLDGMRQKRELQNPFKLICLSSLPAENMRLRRRANHLYELAPSRPKEGRWPSSRTLGGMRWTQRCRKTNDKTADGEVVWSWHLDADVKLATMLAHCAGDGDKKPDHQGEHEGNR